MRLDHVGLSVSSLDRSRKFYAEVLGFSRQEDAFALPAAEIRGLILVNPSGARVELFERLGSTPSPKGHPTDSARCQGLFQFALRVEDVDAVYAQVTAAGAAPVLTPRVAPDGQCRIAFIADPDGNLVELIQRPPQT